VVCFPVLSSSFFLTKSKREEEEKRGKREGKRGDRSYLFRGFACDGFRDWV
jgi:hypothetical protein